MFQQGFGILFALTAFDFMALIAFDRLNIAVNLRAWVIFPAVEK